MTRESINTTIPRTFLDCVQRIALIQLGSNFTSEFILWHLQLRTTEHRLRRWGKAAGILHEHLKPFWKQPVGEYDPQHIQKACYALKEILKQLSRAREDSDDIFEFSNAQELTLIDGFLQLSLCEPHEKEADRVLEKLRSRYQSGLQSTPEAVNCSKWALYEPKQLEKLLDAIDEHVRILETLFPRQLRTLAAQEATGLDFEAIQALASVIQGRDPILASALEDGLPTGSSWKNINTKGNARAHLGNIYSKEPQDQGPFSWSGLVIGGDSIVHAGHTYR